MSKKKFISEVFKATGTIGALSPSSSFLAQKMTAPIAFEHANCIVEFGPGTGVFTHKLLEKMHPEAILLAFEINPVFIEELENIQDNRLVVIQDSAEKISEYLQQYQQQQADYIVSSLPFAMIPNEIVDTILQQSDAVLAPQGKFIQFQYSLNAKKRLERFFHKVAIHFTLFNLPPAFVYVCEK